MTYDYRSVTAATVADETDAALAAAEQHIARAVASAAAPSLADTLAPIELANAAVGTGYGRGAFMAQVATDAAVRDAGSEAEERITKWRVGLAFRDDLYAAVRALADSPAGAALEGEDRRLLDFWLRDFRRAGQELGAAQRRELEALRSRLVELEVAFQRNISEFSDGIEVTREELAGMPDSYVERLQPGERPGTLRVSLDYPEFTPFLERGSRRDLREALFRKNWNKAVEANRPLLTEALALRRKVAALLGYPTWAHIATEVRMSGDPDRVAAFYDELIPPIRAAAATETDKLGGMMAADGIEGTLQSLGLAVLRQRRAARQLRDRPDRDRRVPAARAGLARPFRDHGRGLRPRLPRGRGRAVMASGRPNVRDSDRASGELLAYAHADLFPREGSSPTLPPSRSSWPGAPRAGTEAGDRDRGELHPAIGRTAALLRHGPRREVETLFHEFGHILHMKPHPRRPTRASAAPTPSTTSLRLRHRSWSTGHGSPS